MDPRVPGGSGLGAAHTKQWVLPAGIESEPVGGGLVAEVFRRQGALPAPAVLLLGGSGGGMGWARRTAGLLADEGLVAMALAYFNADGLPPDLVELPLEQVGLALDSLEARDDVDARRIGVVGYSKGAELGLLVASRRRDVTSVVAFAPGSTTGSSKRTTGCICGTEHWHSIRPSRMRRSPWRGSTATSS